MSEDVRARILRAGVNWCAFSHQHDNSKAALAAAREALVIAKERIKARTVAVDQRQVVARVNNWCVDEIDKLLAELADPPSGETRS